MRVASRIGTAGLLGAALLAGIVGAAPRSPAWGPLSAAPAASAAPRETLPWAPGLDAATAEAKKRNVALLVVLVLEREPGNERMLAEEYAKPALREASKKLVVTIASIASHSSAEESADGRKLCSKFGRVTCAEHQATESVVRGSWLHAGPKDDIFCPRHIFRAPDGRFLFERVQTLDAEELVKLIDRAISACTPESLAAWDTVPGRIARISDPLYCIRRAALQALLGANDPAVDAQLFDFVKKAEKGETASEVLAAIGAAIRASNRIAEGGGADVGEGGQGIGVSPPPTPEIAKALSASRGEALRKLLAAPSATVRMHAAAAVSAQKGQTSFDALLAQAGKEKDVRTRCVLVRALAVVGGDAAKTKDALIKFAKSQDDDVRSNALVALEAHAADPAVADLAKKTALHEKTAVVVRAAACWLLGLSGQKSAVADIAPILEEHNELLKRAATLATDRLNGKDVRDYASFRWWVAPLAVRIGE